MSNMLKLIYIVLFFLSTQLHATLLVELAEDSNGDPTIDVGYNDAASSFPISLYKDDLSSNNGSSASNPITVYVPIVDGTVANANFVQSNGGTYTKANINIRLNFLVTTENEDVSSDAFSVYGGVYKNESDTTIQIFDFDSANSTSDDIAEGVKDQQVNFVFSLNTMCLADTTNFDCDIFTNDDQLLEMRAFFYLAEKDTDPDSATIGSGGLHFKFVLSNKYNEGKTTSFTNSEADPGDNRLYADITSSSEYNYPLATYLLVNTAGAAISSGTYGAVVTGNTKVSEVLAYTKSGEIVFQYQDGTNTPLANDTTYCISLVQVNKFYLTNLVANGICGTPKDIETLLEEKQCYLLTAGFGRDHKVINFFRDFRDNFLMNFSFGQSFIEFYYKTAPKYTSFIYSSPKLSFFIRLMAWFLYYIIKFQYVIYAFLIILILGKTYLTWSTRRTKVS